MVLCEPWQQAIVFNSFHLSKYILYYPSEHVKLEAWALTLALRVGQALMGITLSRVTTSHNLTPEYRSQDGSGTLGYHRFEDRSIILSRTTLIEVYTLSLISVFWAQDYYNPIYRMLF